jgi:hypothetical protein
LGGDPLVNSSLVVDEHVTETSKVIVEVKNSVLVAFWVMVACH